MTAESAVPVENGEDTTTTLLEDDDDVVVEAPSLIIPITSTVTEPNFIEIFPEELKEIPSSTLLQVLKDEDAEMGVWANVGLAYMRQGLAGESSAILQAACDRPSGSSSGNADERVRLLASAGIAHLALGKTTTSGSSSSQQNDEHRVLADQRFTSASKVNTFFPMTWMGKGCLNFMANRLEQARFFFDTTLKQCGQVLPALLGMASVLYREKDYRGAQEMYAKAIRLYPDLGGAAVRVGFGMACYRLGQVDRAKAAFARALELDPEFVPAMVGSSILDMASLDSTQPDFVVRTEKAIRMMSMANLLDHNNAMVQNHLANHYFWKWTPIAGTTSVTKGSKLVQGSQPMPLDEGEHVRIGTDFETVVEKEQEDDDDDEDKASFRVKDVWKGESAVGLKLWKKDYDRVSDLAKGAYSSTAVKEIQAESCFQLARVHHVREEIDAAQKLYERACKLAPDLAPARFGLAQTLVAKDMHKEAAAHLRLVLGTSSSTATDALALLGLLQVKGGNIKEGLGFLKKAIDLDPLNPDLLELEALALQQQKSDYPKSLERYRKAMELRTKQDKAIPHELYCNIGVLCHETKQYQESVDMYLEALKVLDSADSAVATLDNVGRPGARVQHQDNHMFWDFMQLSDLQLLPVSPTKLKLQGGDSSSHSLLRVGDHVKIVESGDKELVTEVLEVENVDGVISIRIKDELSESSFPRPKTKAVEKPAEEKKEASEQPSDGKEGDKEEGDKEGEKEGDKESPPELEVPDGQEAGSQVDDPMETDNPQQPSEAPPAEGAEAEKQAEQMDVDQVKPEAPTAEGENANDAPQNLEGTTQEPAEELPPPTPLNFFFKRENKRLENPQAITIAFNIARVHENAGRTLAAVELLKAIAKRVPAYVNCYLRLACIARDCGSLRECSAWLKIACQAAPGNPEVLTLVGNLHLSLCDWGPAQNVFDQLLMKRVSSVEAYSKLSMGNIYFANLNVPKNYGKHLKKAADLYKSILQKDKANAYAANGIGTILAEKGEIFKAKEVFNRVREVSSDTIADAHLNLGHIYLAQKKHPEALQMYQSYMKRTQDGTAPITTKSRADDEAEVLLYIAFAYFDWARQTELLNNAQAAPADERYRKCIEHLDMALKKSKRKEVLLQYNLCMTKLQAANCVLQKQSRNIRRTAQEVQDALDGLEESLPKVEEILRWKTEGKKIQIPTSVLQDFITHCRANIDSAKLHLEEEKKQEAEANEIREWQRVTAETQKQEEKVRLALKKEEELKKQEERDRKAAANMIKVEQLRQGWELEATLEKAAAAKKRNKVKPPPPEELQEEDARGLFDDDDDDAEAPPVDTARLFASDSEDEQPPKPDDGLEGDIGSAPRQETTQKDLFGSSDESDEDLLADVRLKRGVPDDDDDDENPQKKIRLFDEDDDDEI